MIVDFPDPFSPARQWISPGGMLRETESRARTPPKRLLMLFNSMRLDIVSRRIPEVSVDWVWPRHRAGATASRQAPARAPSEVVGVHVLGGHADPASAIKQIGAAFVRRREGVVALETEVEPFLNLVTLAFQGCHGKHVHGIACNGGIPELDVLDVAVSQILTRNGRQPGAGEEDLVLQATLGDQASRTRRRRHGRAKDALDLWIGRHGFFQLGVV